MRDNQNIRSHRSEKTHCRMSLPNTSLGLTVQAKFDPFLSQNLSSRRKHNMGSRWQNDVTLFWVCTTHPGSTSDKSHHTPSILHNFIHSCLYTVEVKGDILPHHKRPIWGNERRPIRRMNTSQIMRICLLLCTSMALTDLLRLQTRKTFFGLKSFSYGHLTSRFKLHIRLIWWFYHMNCQSRWVSMEP